MIVDVRITHEEINVNKVIKEMIKNSSSEGSLVMFLGYVKEFVDGHRVNKLIYEAYEPYSTQILKRIASEVMDDDVTDVRVYHRVGVLRPHEPIIYIFVIAKNRSKAFEKCKELLERIKREVPIFKLEVRDDGEYWIVGDGLRIKRDSL